MSTTKPYSSAMAKKGVNHIRSIIENANSIFHEIHQENDYGSDALIELVDGQKVTGITIAAQIKSGKSFCTDKICKIPASKNHYEYWFNHKSPFIGIVYDPDFDKAFWINIKSRINKDIIEKGPYTIKFKKTELAEFTEESFKSIFLPIFLEKDIYLTLDTSIKYAGSTDFDEHSLGISRLIRLYYNKKESWECLLELFEKREVSNLSPIIIYYIAHIHWHGDICGLDIPETVRIEIKERISHYNDNNIKKMLSMIDEDAGFERGSLGQNAEAIISIITNKEEKLKNIINDFSCDNKIRNMAITLYAHYKGPSAITYFERMRQKDEHSNILKYIIDDLKKYGHIAIQ